MHPLFDPSSLMTAARQAAAQQHYPQGALYLVATPIGNVADMGLRALYVLDLVDLVACEDTRHTAQLLQMLGLHKPLLALHQHNEAEAAQTVLERLCAGQRVAYVSDAGTPGVSDPGARLVAAAQAQGLRCLPIPGASSLTALLSVAGHGGDDPRFVFHGFLPAKGQERALALAAIGEDRRGHLLLEAPHRIEALAQALQPLDQRRLTVGRELTKQFEEVCTLPARDWAAHLAAHANHRKGEFAVFVHPAPRTENPEALSPASERVLRLLLGELPTKQAVRLCAEITGDNRNDLYARALALKATTTPD